jgi:chemotaxis protein CheD
MSPAGNLPPAANPAAATQLVVGISDCVVSNDAAAVLVTYALGSCIAVSIYDPMARVGGLLHIMLPESQIDQQRAEQTPFMFADTGVPLLFRKAYEQGAAKARLVVRLAGGAQVMDDARIFNIGKRNYLAVRKILWKAGVFIQAEAVGGDVSRTVRLDLSSGSFWIREGGTKEWEIKLKGGRPV